ncbi:MAG: hypothetical protein LIQ31_09235 [Planctomycetes bacterium]|nr:hypothetical protein [Planctomycetota bacterium]
MRGRNSYYSHNASHGAAPGSGGGTSILLGFLLGMGAIVIGAICICILYFGYTYADRLESLESGIRAVASAERAPVQEVSAAEAAKAAAAGVGESIARILEAHRAAAVLNAPAPAPAAPVQAPSPQIYLMMGAGRERRPPL